MADNFKYEIKREVSGDIKVEVTADKEAYQNSLDHAYAHLKSEVKVPGFRPGKAPRHSIEARLGSKLLEAAINDLLPRIAEQIVDSEKLRPMTNLEYNLLDVTSDNQVKFEFTFAAYPEIKLPDFTKLKVKKVPAAVSEKDINEVLVRLFKEHYRKTAKLQPDSEVDEAAVLGSIGDAEVKEVMGEEFASLDKLKSEILKQLTAVKERESEERFSEELVKQAVQSSKITLPKRVVELELKRKEEAYRARIKDLEIDLDVFLAAQNTSWEKLTAEWREQVVTEVSSELLLSEVADKHSVLPTLADIEAEIGKVTDPRMKSQLNSNSGKRYVASVLVQQRGLQKLIELAQAA